MVIEQFELLVLYEGNNARVEVRLDRETVWLIQDQVGLLLGRKRPVCRGWMWSGVAFCTNEEYMILLHGFIKKSQKTPAHELAVAVKRMKGLKP